MSKRFSLTSYLKPGESINIDGKRGSGKTHTAITLAYRFLNVKDAEKRRCRYVLSNCPMVYCDKDGKKRRGDPPHYHTVKSTEELFRKITEIMLEHVDELDALNIVVLFDEAHQILSGLAAVSMSKTSVSLHLTLWNVFRKFRVCTVCLTPTLTSLGKRHRTWLNSGGLMSVYLHKSATLRVPRGEDPRDYTLVQVDEESNPLPIKIGSCPWTHPPKDGESGYYFDTLAISTFDTAEEESKDAFHIDTLLKRVSGLMAEEIPSEMEKYFLEVDSHRKDEKKSVPIDNLYNCDMDWITRMRAVGITWQTIGMVTQECLQTVKSKYDRFLTTEQGREPHKIADIENKKIRCVK